jgi:hypothetical protein
MERTIVVPALTPLLPLVNSDRPSESVITFGEMDDLIIVFALAVACAVILLLSLALKVMLKKLFIVLAASMIVSGIVSYFEHSP